MARDEEMHHGHREGVCDDALRARLLAMFLRTDHGVLLTLKLFLLRLNCDLVRRIELRM
ncbi:hypothetical protein CERZMDRAFT_108347 [Cercospora zeae-maydis SCOH1-5]|uniref:Uncharacterized protein n=1 Tax=Cercospora zeae-maydis SCOH1-5 TaxID=717836 RepID=A0A6A6FW11_9PEZI|nr:hypothetical protein CERZMDRAFT_108347 [Cercospora zeae-maydis SCOH1-5]